MRAACAVAARSSLDSACNPRRAFFLGHGLGCTFAKALFCRRRRRAPGAFEGLPALKPVFDSPYACAVPQLGPQKRNERKRAGNLFRIGCDSEASRSHGLTRGGAILLSASSFSAAPRARSPPPARAQGAPPPAQRQTSSGGGLMSGLMGTVAQVRAQRGAGEGAKFPCAAAVGRRLVAVRLDGARARPSWAPWGDMHGLYARDPSLRRPRAHELEARALHCVRGCAAHTRGTTALAAGATMVSAGLSIG